MNYSYEQDGRTTSEWIHDLVVARQEAEAARDTLAQRLAEIDSRVEGAHGIHGRNHLVEWRLKKVRELADEWAERENGRVRGFAARLRAILDAKP